jgi:hypothetical protein
MKIPTGILWGFIKLTWSLLTEYDHSLYHKKVNLVTQIKQTLV